MINYCHLLKSGSRAVLLSLLYALFAPAHAVVGAEANWQVNEAPLRFKVSLSGKPTEKSCGYLVILPDGGILPGPAPLTHVVTDSGKQVPSYILWHNRASGAAVVFEDPGSDGDVSIYVSGGDKAKVWDPGSGLTPGPIVCAEAGSDSLENARKLSKPGEASPRAHFQKYGNPYIPFGMNGDVQGRLPPVSYYVLAYVITKDPGKTLVALTKMHGACDVQVDGQALNPQRISSKPGGTGQWMDLSKGLHRVDVFCSIGAAAPRRGDNKEPGCEWTMGWKPPNTTIQELGGPRPNDLPSPGTSMWESHKINAGEVARSGVCKIMQVDTKDGAPAAVARLEGTETFWFGDDPPIFLYECSALTAGNPKDTTYIWAFGDKATLQGPKVPWFFTRGDQTITLTTASGGKQSSCTLPFYAFSGSRSSMDSETTRENFRRACFSTLKAFPPDTDPTTSWNATMWKCFYDSQELGKGYELLEDILTKRWVFFQKKVPVEKQVMMEDVFFNGVAQADPERAIKWLTEQGKVTTAPEKKNDLKVKLAEVYMYQKPNLDEAKKILTLIAKGKDDAATLATIRLGDVAFLERNMSEANNFWGQVQSKVKLTKSAIEGEGTAIKWDEGPAEKKRKHEHEKEAKAFTAPAITAENVADWKKSAVVDTSKAMSVITLINQGFILEAYQQLRNWERTMPMSKSSGDFIIQEAKFYLHTGNTKRSRLLLEAYCENVDATSYVADAAGVLLDCMMKDKEPDKALQKFCDDMKKRFDNHPALVERLNDLMRLIGADGVKREETKDKF